MTTYLVFLRGVMPYGKNRVPMKVLQGLLRKHGYPDAQTYLHTGNIILNSSDDSLILAKNIHNLINEFIGPDLAVIVRTPQEITELLDKNPFTEPAYKQNRVFFCMMEHISETSPLDLINKKINDTDEKISLQENNAFLYIPGNAGRSKLNNQLLEKSFKTTSTSRNFNTLHKVLSIAQSFEVEE